jgi:hypothetical protein
MDDETMNLTETQQLLREISAVDKRNVDQATTQVWFQILGHIPLEIAQMAHILARKDDRIPYLEPKHIVAWAREAAFKLDRDKPRPEDKVVDIAPEPTCKAHQIKIMSCRPCCRLLADMGHLRTPELLIWAKENIYA